MGQHKIDSMVRCVRLIDRPLHVVDEYKEFRKVGAGGLVWNFINASLLNTPKGIYLVNVGGQVTSFWADELESYKIEEV